MKTLYITLFLFLISIYFTNCYCPEYFKGVLQNQCENLVNNDTHYCSYSNGECTTQQKLCTSYTGTDEQQCNSIKPKDSTKKCTIKDSHCTEVPKECKDFVSGITLCSNLMLVMINKDAFYREGNVFRIIKVAKILLLE